MQFLTYRWGRKYETHNVGTYGPQVKEGGMCLNDEIHRGNHRQTSAGTEWWGESVDNHPTLGPWRNYNR